MPRSTNTSLLSWNRARVSSKRARVVVVWDGSCARKRKSRTACTTAMIRRGDTCPPGTGRSITRPRRKWLMFLCSLPVTRLSQDMPLPKIVMWWLGGIDRHRASISEAPKVSISHANRCLKTPCSNWCRMSGVMDTKAFVSGSECQKGWNTGFCSSLRQAEWNTCASPSERL